MNDDPDTHFCEPRHGHGLPHHPFNAIVGPRPIGWTTAKDSLRKARTTGEFPWNLLTRPLAEAMNASSATVPPETNEFELAGLAAAASRRVQVPRVAASPVGVECRVSQIVPLQDADDTVTPATLALGEVVAIRIRRDLPKDGICDTAAAQPVRRGGGPADYFQITEAQRLRRFRPR